MSASGSETRQRANVIAVRVDALEKDAIAQSAAERSMPVSAYVRHMALSQSVPNRSRVSQADRQHIALILACLGRIMDELRKLEGCGQPYAGGRQMDTDLVGTMAITRALLEARDHCFEALRKKP